MAMHPSNPFFNPETHERREPSPGPTTPSTPERHSTNPFRRPKRTSMATSHAEADGHSCSDLLTTSDSEPDLEIPRSPATTETPHSETMTDSPQEGAASHPDTAGTAAVPTSTPAAGNIPADIRAQRAGRRGLNLHVHWSDHEAEAAAATASSSSTPAPQQNEQPTETTTTTASQPQNPHAQPPTNPPNQSPAAPSASRPSGNTPNNMYIIQQPHVAYQAPVPMIMTNPPYVMPRQALPTGVLGAIRSSVTPRSGPVPPITLPTSPSSSRTQLARRCQQGLSSAQARRTPMFSTIEQALRFS
ncbi:uncharacterized protein PG986_011057 [Apiospora aurea]|uniref:Uncharacterized protein n=1 Tax=Apiospora aurea TaxID=335848 RepID=A0ABR1Q4G0_9PEZI